MWCVCAEQFSDFEIAPVARAWVCADAPFWLAPLDSALPTSLPPYLASQFRDSGSDQ